MWGGDSLNHKPEYFITPVLSWDASLAAYHSYTVDSYSEFGSVYGNGKELSPNATYYLLLQGGGPKGKDQTYDAKVSINCYEDAEVDSATDAEVLSEAVKKSGTIDGKGDIDVFCFDTKTDKYMLKVTQDKSMKYRIYSDSELSDCVYSDSFSNATGSADMERCLKDNTRYYITVERDVYNSAVPLNYSIAFEKKDSGTEDKEDTSKAPTDITVKDGDIAGQELELFETTEITVKQAEQYDSYMVFPFTTTPMKAYYNVLWESSYDKDISYYVYSSADRASENLIKFGYLDEYGELGSVLGLGEKLSPLETYYLCLKRDSEKDYSGKIKVINVMDEEADTSELAEPIIPGTVKYGSIDSNEDIDVFYLDTGKKSYSFSADADDIVLIDIYKDKSLEKSVYQTSAHKNKTDKDVDLTSVLDKNQTYYVVVHHWADPKGDQIGYELCFNAKTSTDNPSSESSVSSKSKTTKNGKYYKKIKSSKSFITNMGSKVKVSFKNGKVTLKKGNGGYLCKKSKAKKYIFHKSAVMKKKKYTYKLAKNCKVVYGKDFYSNSKITETVKNTKWVKKSFKNGGGGKSIGLCLNKKKQVYMIYVSGFDVYCEQM